MDGAVDHEAGAIDRVGRAIQHVAIEIDAHQVGGGDFPVMQAEGIDQELLVVFREAGNARRDVVEHQLGPAEPVDQPVAGRELQAQLPFRLGEFFRPQLRGFLDALVHASVPHLV